MGVVELTRPVLYKHRVGAHKHRVGARKHMSHDLLGGEVHASQDNPSRMHLAIHTCGMGGAQQSLAGI